MLKTFNEWREEGMYVLKGEHACHRENGKCYFNETQVISKQDLARVIQNKYNSLKACKEKLIDDKRIYDNNNHKQFTAYEQEVSYNKENALAWLAYQGSSIYNENCNELDGMGVCDVVNELF